ncbi:O-antigen ligase family protein [Tsuneonella sp. HG249]
MRVRALERVSRRAGQPGFRFAMLAVLVGVVFLTGGGARSDIVSLAFLRPIAAMFAACAVLLITRDQLRSIRMPLIFLGLAGFLVALQLVPLPPGMWAELPARDVYADAYRAAGIALPWEPLAISPARAWNSLFSLIIPLAVLLTYAIQDESHRPAVMKVIWIAAIASVALGMLQLLGSPRGALYLYRITNNGLPVGLFSNRNHQGLMVAVGILLAGMILARSLRRPRISFPLIACTGGSILVFAPFLLLAGSRAGLLLGLVMTAISVIMISHASSRRKTEGKATRKTSRFSGHGLIAAGAILLAVVMGAMLWFSRSLAFDRLVEKNVELDLRLQVMPVVVDMGRDQIPFGSGFGSFEFLYRQFEPFELLMPSYLNHAHNDWLQVVIEGGLPAVALLAVFIAWFGHTAFMLARRNGWRPSVDDMGAVVIIGAFGVYSIVDYPLRAPSLAAVFAICCAHLAVSRAKG